MKKIGVICEIVKDEGKVKRGKDVEDLEEEKKLKRVKVEDIIEYRKRKEKMVRRIGDENVEKCDGKDNEYSYEMKWEKMKNVEVVLGDIREGEEVKVSINREDVMKDVLGKGGRNIDEIMKRMGKEGRGIMVYMSEG